MFTLQAGLHSPLPLAMQKEMKISNSNQHQKAQKRRVHDAQRSAQHKNPPSPKAGGKSAPLLTAVGREPPALPNPAPQRYGCEAVSSCEPSSALSPHRARVRYSGDLTCDTGMRDPAADTERASSLPSNLLRAPRTLSLRAVSNSPRIASALC